MGFKANIVLALFTLLLSCGCQPYVDHGAEPINWEAAKIDFGTRRSLKVVRFEGDREKLIVEFNQPLQTPDSKGEKVPFQVAIRPRTAVAEILYTGVSRIQVTFVEKLPPARSYQAEISPGWRALTGASLLRPVVLEWETDRPRVISASSVVDETGVAEFDLLLKFDQAVEMESVKDVVSLHNVADESIVELRDWELLPEQTSARASIVGMKSLGTFRLAVGPGLRSKDGSLEGIGGEVFPLGTPPKFSYLGDTVQTLGPGEPVRLEFSEPVDREELRRHIQGVDWRKAYIKTDDGLHFEVLWLEEQRTHSRAGHLVVLGDLTSLNGSKLNQDVNLVFDDPVSDTDSMDGQRRQFIPLTPSETVLPVTIEKGAKVATWRLSVAQAARLTTVSKSKWQNKKKLSAELSKPVFQQTAKKKFPATRFLKKDAQWVEKSPYGLFLVRTVSKNVVTRKLVMRTGSLVDQSVVNSTISCHVETRKSGRARGGAQILVLDEKGRFLAEGVSTDVNGKAVLGGPWSSKPMFLLTKWGEDQHLQTLHHVEVKGPPVLPGLIWADSPVYETGQEFQFFGLWWSGWARPEILLVDENGRKVDTKLDITDETGFFFGGSSRAPLEEGDFFLKLPSEYDLAPSFPFKVTDHPVLERHPSQLTLEMGEDGEYSGKYSWDGPGGKNLAVRASINFVGGVFHGWRSVRVNQALWIPLEVEVRQTLDGAEYSLSEVPTMEGPWELLVELYDKREPGRVFRRQRKQLGKAALLLELAEIKHLDTDHRRARFRFQFPDSGTNPSIQLQCQLWLKEVGASEWKALESDTATWKDGAFEWLTRIDGAGAARLQASWVDEATGEFYIAFWERQLSRDSLADWTPLELSDEVFNPGRPVGISWPGLTEGTPVWVQVLSSKDVIHRSRRVCGKNGSLGELDLQQVNPGCKEVILVATSRSDRVLNNKLPELQIRANRVDVVSGTAFLDAVLSSDFELDSPIVARPGESVTVEIEYQKAALESTLFWWEVAPDATRFSETSEKTTLERLIGTTKESYATIHGTPSLPVLGPRPPEGDSATLDAPDLPGTYRLLFLGQDEEKTVVFAERQVIVTEGARWAALVPPYIRPGDAFSAGVRFWADPEESGPTGANSTIELESTLIPVSYFSTNALVERGDTGDMLFDYEAPDHFAEGQAGQLELAWELGVEGEAHRVKTKLKSIPTKTVSKVYRDGTLTSGRGVRLNLKGFELWKLELQKLTDEDPEDSILSVLGVEKTPLNVPLFEGSREFYGTGDTLLEVRHESGDDVRLKVVHLQPDSREPKAEAKGLYVLQDLETPQGERVERSRLEMGREYLLLYHLVVPKKIASTNFRAPIPGGLEALGCWLRGADGKLTPIPWSDVQGVLEAQLPELSAGELELIISVEAVVAGDYSWPGCKVLEEMSRRKLAATQNSRVKIAAP